MAGRTTPPTLIRRELRERAGLTLGPLADGTPRVDRERGVIRRVKVLGLESVNGRRYLREAVKAAVPLYEGASVRINHLHDKDKDRPSEDVFGWLRGVEQDGDGCLYGDLHYLKAHPMADRVAEAAERNPLLYGLSHNAQGEGEPEDGVFVVRKIVEVHSVDLVADPATNKGLFESDQRIQTMKVSVKTHLLEKCLHALSVGRRRRLEKLCEAMPAARLMEAGADGEDHRDTMYKAMRACEDAGDDEGATGIHKLMGPKKKEDEEEGEDEEERDTEEDEGEDDGEERDTEESEDDEEESGSDELRGKNQDGQVKAIFHKDGGDYYPGNDESRKLRKKHGKGTKALTESEVRSICEAEGLTVVRGKKAKVRTPPRPAALTESRARSLCKLADVECDAELLAILTESTAPQAEAILGRLKKALKSPGGGGPKSRGLARQPGTDLSEGRPEGAIPADTPESLMNWLRN